MKTNWPKSLPDYAWPDKYASTGWTVVRLTMAAIFYAGYLAGSAVNFFDKRRGRSLVIRTDGLGDALLFEPALESLARTMSPQPLNLWAPKLTCEMLADCPSLHRLRVIPRGFLEGNLRYFVSPIWRAKIGYMLGRWEFERVVYPVESPEPMGNWLFESVRAKERWLNYGDTTHQFDWQQTHAHKQATFVIENRPGHAHELLRNEYLAQQWSEDKKLRKPKLHLSDEAIEHAKKQIDAWRLSAKRQNGNELVAVIPAAAKTINSYPTEKWTEALRRLWDEFRSVPVLLGGPSDASTLHSLAAELSTMQIPSLRLPHAMKIREMAALVGQMDGVLSVDTGLAHLAVTQSVPTVVLVGGGNPGRFFPWPKTKNQVALNVSTPCAHCNNRCTEAEPICITHIAPEEIAAAYAQLKGRRVTVHLHVAAEEKRARAVS